MPYKTVLVVYRTAEVTTTGQSTKKVLEKLLGDIVEELTNFQTMTSLVIFVVLVAAAQAQFNPTLTVDSCTQSKLILSVTDAANNGIIYIQGQGASCKQTTLAGTMTHEFDFASCGIQWESSFKIIVQKNSLYQTGADKQIPIMCISDLSDLTVTNNLNALDKADDAGQNLTVKPTGSMTLYSNGLDVGGGSVQLTDTVTMSIALDTNFIQDFDIKAVTCTASTITVIDTSCATDTELFPNFGKPAQGQLSATFGAFRTTDLTGGSVAMTFSCTLQVCLGSCTATTCSNGESGHGRKRRSLVKRQAEEEGIEEINVGATLKIAAEEVILEGPEDDGSICMDKMAFIAGMIAMVTALTTSAATAGIMAKKLRAKAAAMEKLNPGLPM